ncbi:hypothetical protein T492DRAFT_935098, partial [Pavlovales sp. CCMP2436]
MPRLTLLACVALALAARGTAASGGAGCSSPLSREGLDARTTTSTCIVGAEGSCPDAQSMYCLAVQVIRSSDAVASGDLGACICLPGFTARNGGCARCTESFALDADGARSGSSLASQLVSQEALMQACTRADDWYVCKRSAARLCDEEPGAVDFRAQCAHLCGLCADAQPGPLTPAAAFKTASAQDLSQAGRGLARVSRVGQMPSRTQPDSSQTLPESPDSPSPHESGRVRASTGSGQAHMSVSPDSTVTTVSSVTSVSSTGGVTAIPPGSSRVAAIGAHAERPPPTPHEPDAVARFEGSAGVSGVLRLHEVDPTEPGDVLLFGGLGGFLPSSALSIEFSEATSCEFALDAPRLSWGAYESKAARSTPPPWSLNPRALAALSWLSLANLEQRRLPFANWEGMRYSWSTKLEGIKNKTRLPPYAR